MKGAPEIHTGERDKGTGTISACRSKSPCGTGPAMQAALPGLWLFCNHSKYPWMHLMLL